MEISLSDTKIAKNGDSAYKRAVITPDQIRAARALLRWRQADLADAAGVASITVRKIEGGEIDPRTSTLRAIQAALESGGVVFLDPGETRDGGPGVRLKATP